MKIFDLSVPTEDSPSEPLPLQVEHQDHKSSVPMMLQFFDATEADLPEGLAWANDKVTMGAHAGTHVDAPWHYYPTTAGKRARTIDEMPLEWYYGDGVVLDFCHKPRGSVISAEEIQEALQKINYTLKPATSS